MRGWHKKIICFADEFGTAGNPGFGFGLVFIWAHDCARADRQFTNLLPPSANEVHSSKWSNNTLQAMMRSYTPQIAETSLLINKMGEPHTGDAAQIYAKTLIEAVKIGLLKFSKAQKISRISNVDLVIDASGLGESEACRKILHDAQQKDGRFKAVRMISHVDSTASRMLQVADVVAYSRKWLEKSNAETVSSQYGIMFL